MCSGKNWGAKVLGNTASSHNQILTLSTFRCVVRLNWGLLNVWLEWDSWVESAGMIRSRGASVSCATMVGWTILQNNHMVLTVFLLKSNGC